MNHPQAPTHFGPPAHFVGAPTRPATGAYPAHSPQQPGSPYSAQRPGPPPGAYRPGPPPGMPGGHRPGQPMNSFAPPPLPPPVQGAPFHPSTPLPVTSKRRRGRVVAAAVAVLAVGGGAAAAWMTFGRNGDQDAIIATMGEFKDAIAAGDVGAVTAQMCAEEAALLDGLELPAGTPPTAPADGGEATEASAGIADLQVKGHLAAATVTDSPDAEKKVYFRKEREQWKVCSFAKADFDSAS